MPLIYPVALKLCDLRVIQDGGLFEVLERALV